MSRLARLKYSVALTGSFKMTFVCAFLFLIPTGIVNLFVRNEYIDEL